MSGHAAALHVANRLYNKCQSKWIFTLLWACFQFKIHRETENEGDSVAWHATKFEAILNVECHAHRLRKFII